MVTDAQRLRARVQECGEGCKSEKLLITDTPQMFTVPMRVVETIIRPFTSAEEPFAEASHALFSRESRSGFQG